MRKKLQIDRRIIRTKLVIRDALIALIIEKGFDAVTVKDIVDHANINRGTFYLHYKDKFDLLDQTETEILEEIQQIFLQANLRQVGNFNTAEHLQRVVIILLEYVREHADLMQAFFELQGNISFINRLRNLAEQYLKLETLTGVSEKNFTISREYLLAYVLHANLGVLRAWFMNGCKESPQEMAQIFLRLSFEGPLHSSGFWTDKPKG